MSRKSFWVVFIAFVLTLALSCTDHGSSVGESVIRTTMLPPTNTRVPFNLVPGPTKAPTTTLSPSTSPTNSVTPDRPTSTALPSPIPLPTQLPTSLPTISATETPTPAPTPTPTPTQVPTATAEPTRVPTATPEPTPIPTPTPDPFLTLRDQLPWAAGITGDITNEHEQWALRYLDDLTIQSVELGALAARLPWVLDGITEDERWTLWLLRDQATSDLSMAKDLMAMPFLTTSFEVRDRHALNSLRLLGEAPANLELVTGQSWFQDGMDDVDAAFLSVLYDLSIRSPGEFTAMVQTRYDKITSFTLPLAGEAEIIAFRPTPFSRTSTALSQAESAVRAMEELMRVPFPRNEIILLFLNPMDFQKSGVITLALHVGTHMVVSRPEVIQGDFAHTLPHEIAHYYWGSLNAPLWFREGGSDFLASYALAQSGQASLQVSLAERRHLLDIGGARRCAISGIDYIQRLIDDLAAQGYSKYQSSLSFLCNYALGEFLLLELYQAMGFDGSSDAWNELYLLSKSEGREVTEVEIRQAFLSHASTDQLDEVLSLYQRWHRGDFPQ